MKNSNIILFFILAVSSAFLNAQQTTYAIIGDFGNGSIDESAVANLVKSWNPQFVITTGDNRYGTTNFDLNVGKNYCEFLAGAEPGIYCDGNGSALNAFFPATGNHDYTDGGGINEYLTYFNLPGAGIQTFGTSGSELYYDFVMGPIHFFVIDSYGATIKGTMTTQYLWLQNQLAASTAKWKIVYFHHPPYSSGKYHGSTQEMRWPFAKWEADAVLSGHEHFYERLNYDGITYFVNGLGGASKYDFSSPLPGSIIQYNSEFGAQKVVADDTSMTFSFINVYGVTIDEHAIFCNKAPSFSADTLPQTFAIEDFLFLNSIAEYASDPDGDTLNYSIISGPTWLTVAPNGDLSGTPVNDDVGLNNWIVEVDDGLLGTDLATLQIAVINTNDDPVFSGDTILETAATEDTTYLNSIAEYASDPDGDTLNYSIISGPTWLTVAPNGDLSGTPVNDDVGLNNWIVEVDDGLLGTDLATLQIAVINTNDDPVFSGDTILETAATEDASYLNSIGGYASDPDGDTLNYSIISGPTWLTVAPNGDLSGTPVNDEVGLNNWIVEVDDGLLGTDLATLQIAVINTNDDPVFSGDTILETAANEDTAYLNSIGGSASDPDGDSLNYSIITGPSWLSVAPNGDLSGTPVNDDVGLNNWIVEVDDGLLGTDLATLQIAVINTNDDPEFSGDTILKTAATEDTTYLNSIGGYASDPDGDTLNYSIISGPTWLTVAPNGDLSGTPVNDDVGLNSWIIEVDDGLLGTDQAILQITVLRKNEDPVSSGYTILGHVTTEDSSETLFILYPNPVSDRLMVQINGWEDKKMLILYNIAGKAVYAESIIAEDVEIDVTSLPKGVYFLKISDENINESKEIIIQ